MFRRPVPSALAAAAVILGMFFAFAGDGIHGYFAPDEMMNLYAAWSPLPAQLIHNERPVGALVYRALFNSFGLNPLPYRVVCFLLLLGNLGLLGLLCARLASREVAALSCLLGAYHAHLADLYYTSSDLFDLLCFLFFYLALVLYFGIRRRGADPNAGQSALILVLYGCALGSKEIAVVWPAFVVLYETIYHRQDLSWSALRLRLARAGWFWTAILAITLSYMAYKTVGAHRMTSNPDYQLHLTVPAFFTGWKHYLAHLFYSTTFSNAQIVTLFAALFALAILAARRELLFAWFVITIGSLPFLFLNPRGFFVAYLTLPGWYLYAGSAMVLLRDTVVRILTRRTPAKPARRQPVLLFAIVAAVLIPLHRREKPDNTAVIVRDYQTHQKLLAQLSARYPKLPHAARILFLSDPYPPDDYILYFIFALQYRDRGIRVDRANVDPSLISKSGNRGYNHVFRWGAAGLEEVPAP